MATSPFTTEFQLLPSEVVEKWHSQDDIEDPPFKRPLRAMLAHHAAVDRGAAIEEESRKVSSGIKFWSVVLFVASVLITLAFFVAFSHPVHAGLILIVGVVSWLFAVKNVRAANSKRTSLAKESATVKLEIEKQYAMSKNLVAEADNKIKDLGPPPPDPVAVPEAAS